jgi:predicted DNA binding CopG/RHH family protein
MKNRGSGRPGLRLRTSRRRKWNEISSMLDEEMSGAPESTERLSKEEMRWYRVAVMDKEPKVKVTIRLRRWQIERARAIAEERGMRGYQTVLDEVITRGLLPGA